MQSSRANQRSSESRPRRRVVWGWLVALAALTALAVPALQGRVYLADDLGEFHLPLRAFYAERLAAGEAFDWLPGLFCGFFVTGEGQLGGYHPLHWVLYRTLPLAAAFDLELLLSYPCLLLGMFVLLRRLVHRREAALIGAIAFTFSGFSLLHFIHPNAVAVIAHLPWLLLAIDEAIRPASSRRQTFALAALALLTGSQLLLGYPQYVWFSLLVEIAFAGWRLTELAQRSARKAADAKEAAPAASNDLYELWRAGLEPGQEGRFTPALRAGCGLAFAKLCGALLGAQQLAPTFAALQASCRQTPDAALANTGALHPLNLTQFFAPYLFQQRVVGANTNELGLYCGAAPALLIVWLWAQRATWGRLTSLARAGFALLAVGLLLAMGEHGYLYALQQYLPLANRFRFPSRAIVIAELGIAMLTAVAWIELRRKASFTPNQSPGAWRAISVGCGLSLALAVVGPLAWPDFVAAHWKIWAGPALFVMAALVVAAAARGRRWASYAAPALLAADLAIYGLSAGAYLETADIEAYRARTVRPPADLPNGARVVYGHGAGDERVGDRLLLTGLARADGYAGLLPRKQLDYQAENVQRAAGALYRGIPPRGAEAAASVATETTWIPIKNPLPRARLVTQSIVGEPPADLSGFDLNRAAISAEQLTLRKAVPGQATIGAERAGSIDVTTIAPSEQLLVLGEAYDSGWQVEVDGRMAPVLRINGDFLGCLTPAGKHELRWRFRPPSVVSGRQISLLGLGLLIAWLLEAWLNGRLSNEPVGGGAMNKSRRSAPSVPPIPLDFSPKKTSAGLPEPAPATLYENPFVRIPQL
jgi:hypothetical protein